MLVEWAGVNRAERRDIVTKYRDEFPGKIVESLPRI
jgi:hypothetical protein